MYRALYAHNSKLPKYLSFEAGDKFTLIDTSISDQWFLAQNGMGQIGYVPFNYIKKIDVVTDQVVKFIDGSIEAIHLHAGADGTYTQDQRVILKKLMKHRSDVIKRATVREKSPKGGGSKRRPAPAPPVEKSSSVDHSNAGERPLNLAVVGRSATISTPVSVSSDKKHMSETTFSKDVERRENADGNSKSTHRSSVVSDNTLSSTSSTSYHGNDDVRKSRSVTSSIGQAPSIVSSTSSISTDIDAADALTSSEISGDVNMKLKYNDNENITSNVDTASITTTDSAGTETESSSNFTEPNVEEDNGIECVSGHQGSFDMNSITTTNTLPPITNPEVVKESDTFQNSVTNTVSPHEGIQLSDIKSNENVTMAHPILKENSTAIADIPLVEGRYFDSNDLDLPPPPPDLQAGCIAENNGDDDDDDGYFNSYALPPAPCNFDDDIMLAGSGGVAEGGTIVVGGEEASDDSDSLDLPATKAIRECSCDDNQSKFDPDGPFAASGSLHLPKERQPELRRSKKRDVERIHQALSSSVVLSSSSPSSSTSMSSSSSSSVDVEQREKELKRLEQLQAYMGVTVTHADCEEMIGQFRLVSQLSHEESHWALLTAMSLLADNLPHIKPSLEILAHRFKLANECPSTGKDYQCEDAVVLEGLVCQLDSVMNDSQQRGHYLRDDLDDIIDVITTLSDTLSKAKPCVSVAAIQNDNYAMIEVIARYYQMETRWLIHSCLLQLVEAVCHIHPQAVTEFLYSQLPLELVAEMQQHSNDDVRFLQVSRALGIVFMRTKASPHKLTLTMDLHFFIWLLGMIEGFNERGRHDDVELLVALVCSYHLQHRDDPQNPVTEALKMAQGHALLECALSFLSKHGDPTHLLNSGITPKTHSVVLLLTHLYDSSDTSDLLYTNDVDALIGIFQQVFRDLSTGESLHRQMLKLLHNFLRCYPDTMSIKSSVSSRLGHLLHNMNDRQGMAKKILEHNKHIFDES